jgi:hypothetical protein
MLRYLTLTLVAEHEDTKPLITKTAAGREPMPVHPPHGLLFCMFLFAFHLVFVLPSGRSRKASPAKIVITLSYFLFEQEHNCSSQNYCFFLLIPSSGILENRKHDVSETGSVSVLR